MIKQITYAALFTALGAGTVYLANEKGGYDQAQLVADTAGKVEVKGAAAAAVLMDDAGKPRPFSDGAKITCAPGGNLDGVWRSDKEWCSDGKGQTWTRDAKGAETIEVIAGKVYSTAVATAVQAVAEGEAIGP